MPLISNCSMMPAWHQLVSMSGHVEESETARKLQLYATSIYQVHSFVCQLDYMGIICKRKFCLDYSRATFAYMALLVFSCYSMTSVLIPREERERALAKRVVIHDLKGKGRAFTLMH